MVGAIALRIILIFFALKLMGLPFLKLGGAALLVWIGIKLLQPEDGSDHSNLKASTHLFGAIQTIILADVVMSLDNVIAVAGAAKGHMGLVVFGIVVSIPLIVWGSKFVLTLMDRFPIVIVFGGGLLGWIAGHMAVTDIVLKPYLEGVPQGVHLAVQAAGATLVVGIGKWLAGRKEAESVSIEELAGSTTD
jgi:YjbE family integral membrane protein